MPLMPTDETREIDEWWEFVEGMMPAMYSCGRIAVSLQGKVAVEKKEADSPIQTSTEVSVVDRLCQEVLMLQAYRLIEGMGIYSEELADCPAELRAMFETDGGDPDCGEPVTLILDPLDGTKAYLEGKDDFCHMAGVLDNKSGRMLCGMIYAPKLNTLMAAVRGGGEVKVFDPWFRHLTSFRPNRGRSFPETIIRSKRMTERDFSRLESGLWERETEPAMSSASVLRMIHGWAGGAVMRGFHGHDTAIGSILLEECGGAALDEKGKAVRYKPDMPRLPLVVMSPDKKMAKAIWRCVTG